MIYHYSSSAYLGSYLNEWLQKAFDSYQEAAEQGHIEAQYKLGMIYNLKGYSNDAERWYKKAAEQGHADAQYGLGHMYERGDGNVLKNKRQAIRWYQEAAIQGHTGAEWSLRYLTEKR